MNISKWAVVMLVIGLFAGVVIFRKVLNKNPDLTMIPKVIPSPGIGITPISISPTPRVSDFPSDNLSLKNFLYPNTSQQEVRDQELTLKSTDSSEQITNWYKKRFSDLHFSVNTVVLNKVNGEVSNLITASNNQQTISVIISKPKSAITSTINVRVLAGDIYQG